MSDWSQHVPRQTAQTPQNLPADPRQQRNEAGGYAWACTDEERLVRFLVLGSEGGTYYIGEPELTVECAQAVLRCAATSPRGTAALIAEIAQERRAPRRQPTLWALALMASKGSLEARKAARAVAGDVLATGYDLLTFVRYAAQLRGWGRLLQGIVADWWARRSAQELAYQCAKYGQREGWSMRDVLRSGGRVVGRRLSTEQAAVARWVGGGGTTARVVSRRQYGGEDLIEYPYPPTAHLPALLEAVNEVREGGSVAQAVRLIEQYGLTREMLPAELLNENRIWEALLQRMPYTAMLRNLGQLSARGVLGNVLVPGSPTEMVAEKIALGKAHPLALFIAGYVYQQGRGERGSLTWPVIPQITAALQEGFYRALGNVPKHDKRVLVAIDVSGSMANGVAGVYGLSCSAAAAVLALATMAQTDNYAILGWNTRIMDLPLRRGMLAGEAFAVMHGVTGGGTDASLPFRWALDQRAQVDCFVVLTDTETWAGRAHPFQLLQQYRATINVHTRAVWGALGATGWDLNMPDDPLSCSVAGLDFGAVQVIDAMCRGGLIDGAAPTVEEV